MEDVNHPIDEALREARAELRRAWAERRPGFERTIHAAGLRPTRPNHLAWRIRSKPDRWKWGLAAAATVVALTLAGSELRQGSAAERLTAVLEEVHQETRLGHWVAPTDFLLDIPGKHLYSRVPVITLPEEWPKVELMPDQENERGIEP